MRTGGGRSQWRLPVVDFVLVVAIGQPQVGLVVGRLDLGLVGVFDEEDMGAAGQWTGPEVIGRRLAGRADVGMSGEHYLGGRGRVLGDDPVQRIVARLGWERGDRGPMAHRQG
ncbi:hypothetical protein AB0M47_30185 [Hamadaea sp. NPDC051192]|uniref:hypothetical protein n=1 Tax=Hamadaea sp. NPDC051192 TaxID=3154940 RepID=UPI0034333D35